MKKLFILISAFSASNFAMAKGEATASQEYVCTIDRSEEALGGDFLNLGLTITFNPESRAVKFALPNGNSVSGIASEYFQAKWNRTNFSITALGVNYILAFEKDKAWASRGGDPIPCIRKH